MKHIFQIFKAVLFIGGVFILPPIQDVYASQISPQKVIELVNQDRIINNIPTLLENENLKRAAWQKAEDMLNNNYFAHTSPKGVTPWYWIEKNGYNYQYAGENLAINFTDPREQHEAWMKSSTHRKNILNPNYIHIGVAVVSGKIDGKVSTIVVQMFGAKKQTLKEEKKEIFSLTSTKPQFEEKKIVRSFNDLENNHSFKKIKLEPAYQTVSLLEIKDNYFAHDFFQKKIKYFTFIFVFVLTIANLLFIYHKNCHNFVKYVNLLVFWIVLFLFF